MARADDDERGRKRRRESAGDGFGGRAEREYVPGAVMRVRMNNFMTHGDVTFEPGPRLNVVVGPNGVGKSAFVCAVCVGLGGSTKLLGRAGSIQDFVKRGTESAWTEITLRGREVGKPIVIRRDFKNRDGGASRWKMNGVEVKHEDVQREMKALNMQLDNLCSFLPQDRVSAFSMLNPQELLQETEKAIGNAEMYKQHEQLKEMKGGIEGLERSVDQKTARLDKLKRENEHLERDVQRFQEREALIADADKMATKIPWLKYNKAYESMAHIKNGYDAIKTKCSDEKQKHNVLFAEYQRIEGPFKEITAEIEQSRRAVKAEKMKLEKAEAQTNKLAGEHNNFKRQLFEARKDAKAAKTKVENRRAVIAKLEASKDQLPEVPVDIDERREALKRAANEKQREIVYADEALQNANMAKRPIQQKCQSLKAQKEAVESVRDQKLESLSKHPNFRQIKEADAWVREHKPTFHGEVLGPLLAEMEVSDHTHQNYIEQHLGPHVLATYIVTDERDERAVSEHMKRFRINVWTRRSSEQHVPGVVSPELRQSGVMTTLDNLFKAKSVVKQALNDTHQICKVYVGDNRLDSTTAEQLFHRNLATQVYCPKGVYVARKSRYASGTFTMIQNDIRQNRLFVRESSGNIEELRKKLDEAMRELEASEQKVIRLQQDSHEKKQKAQEISRQRQALNSMAQEPEQRRRQIESRIAQNKALMAEDEKAADVSTLERKIAKDQEHNDKERIRWAIQMCDAVEAEHAASKELTLKLLQSMEKRVQMEETESRLRDIETRIESLKAQRQEIKDKFATAKNKCLVLKGEAESVVTLTDEVHKMFEEWPDTVEELEFEIQNLREQADAILCHNPTVLDEFNKRRAEMTSLTRTLESEKEELAMKQKGIDDVKRQWLPQLKEKIQKISDEFQSNFARIGCAGQVTLAGDGSREHDGGFGDDFREYSLEIRVKFRPNEDMHLLDAHRQSGGERSVTTMLYMIALQAHTSAPFRVVDEINQGMDARNERKVFKRMVEAASIPGTPQCFVVTPKLLTQLEYSEDCTVMCIFNGPHVHEMATKWTEMQRAFNGVEQQALLA